MEKSEKGETVDCDSPNELKTIKQKGLFELLTVDEVAQWLRVHRTTVTRYAKSGELKSYKIGSRRLFKSNDVVEFFENQVDREYVFGEVQ
jgi:excisionase family DNA binding protein